MPQSMRTRARPVSSRNWDPVTVVAPPRNWRYIPGWCHRGRPARSVRPYARPVSGALRFEDLEERYAALRNAFGALVVARHRGEDVTDREREYGRDRVRVGSA